MSATDCRSLLKQQDSLINYIRKQESVIYYVAHDSKDECGYRIPSGVLVACDPITLTKLQAHAKRYYPNMSVIPMTAEQYYYHNMRCLGTIIVNERM